MGHFGFDVVISLCGFANNTTEANMPRQGMWWIQRLVRVLLSVSIAVVRADDPGAHRGCGVCGESTVVRLECATPHELCSWGVVCAVRL